MNSADLPASIGEYDILGELGRGSVGIVYKARHRELERLVALKVVREDEVAAPADLERFLRGARAAARLNHPHIVQIYEVGRVDDCVYSAMALIEGPTLRERIRQGPLPAADARKLMEKLAGAVSHAHAQGVVHRDLNPDSILLDSSGLPRITGFGTARLTQKGQSLTTATGEASFETAPEFVTGQGDTASPSVDVYGLGTVLYSALTGKSVFAGVSVAELPSAISDSIPPSPRKMNSNVSRDLEEVCRRSLSKNPADRYSTVAELSAVLGALNPPKSTTSAAAPAMTPRRPIGIRRWLLMACGLSIIAGGMAAAWLRFGVRPEPAGISDGVPASAVAPFDASQARALQEAWARHLGVPLEHENSIGMRFRLIPPGEFDMGATPEEVANLHQSYSVRKPLEDWDKPVIGSAVPKHRVRITRPFYLGSCEVTVEQFARFVRETGYVTDAEKSPAGGGAIDVKTGSFTSGKQYSWKNAGFSQSDHHPVVNFSYNDSIAFCNWLSNGDGRTYRLPTEAEWEYSARAGTTTPHYSGADVTSLKGYENLPDDSIRGIVPFQKSFSWLPWNDGHVFSAPVGSFLPNPFGLHDILGNTGELTADWFDPTYYAHSPETDPQGPQTGSVCVYRGGGFEMNAAKEWCNAIARVGFCSRSEPNIVNAIRIVVEIPAAENAKISFQDASQLDDAGERHRAESLIAQAEQLPITEEFAGQWVIELWRRALTAAQAATARTDRDGAQRLTKRAEAGLARAEDHLARVRKEVPLWNAILAADQLATARPGPPGKLFDAAAAAAACAQAFQAYGYEPDNTNISVLVRALEDRPTRVKDQVLIGLQVWEIYADASGNTGAAEQLRTAQLFVDEDPWRARARAVRTALDAAGILPLATETAKNPLSVEQHELLARVILTRGLLTRPESLAFFRESARLFPAAFWPNLGLGLALSENAKKLPENAPNLDLDVAFRSLQTAKAARPESRCVNGPLSVVSDRITVMEQIAIDEKQVAEWVLAKGGAVQVWNWRPKAEPWAPFPVRSRDRLAKPDFHVSGVWLDDCPVTDEDLMQLTRLPHLDKVSLNGTPVTDDGLKRWFARMKRLQTLSLERTTASDTCLQGIPIVDELLIRNTKTTANGVAWWKDTRPNAFVVHEARLPAQEPAASNPSDFALWFDESSRVEATIDIPEGTLLTWEAWVRPKAVPGCRNQNIAQIRKVDSNRNQRFNFYEGRQAGFEWWGEKYSWTASPAQTQVDMYDRPLHLAAVSEKGETRLYVDGQLVVRQSIPAQNLGPKAVVMIGGDQFDAFRQFQGLIDEVRISSVARYSDKFTPSSRHEADPQTLLLYHFDEGKGGLASDASGHSHHGKILGASWVRKDNLRQFEQGQWLLTMARKARQKKDYGEAVSRVRQAIGTCPDLPSGKSELAAALILNGQEADAEPVLQEIVAGTPDKHAAINALAVVFRIVELPQSGIDPSADESAIRQGATDRLWQSIRKYRLQSDEDAPPPAMAPFSAEQASRHQGAWATFLGLPVEYTNSIGMTFRLIPPGDFVMGSSPAEVDEALGLVGGNEHWQRCIHSESPQFRILLTQPFYLGVHEVQQLQYQKVMNQNPSYFSSKGVGKDSSAGLDTSRFPVENVTWNEIAEFCDKLSEQEAFAPCMSEPGQVTSSMIGYRLPTEAEWEFACRAGTTTKYWSGNKVEDLMRAGWFNGNSSGRPHMAGELMANPFGLFDTHGNVWERLLDRWEPNRKEQLQQCFVVNPGCPPARELQCTCTGGGHDFSETFNRSAFRSPLASTAKFGNNGFRVALSVAAVKQAVKSDPAKIP